VSIFAVAVGFPFGQISDLSRFEWTPFWIHAPYSEVVYPRLYLLMIEQNAEIEMVTVVLSMRGILERIIVNGKRIGRSDHIAIAS
jgi:hypothetical protein